MTSLTRKINTQKEFNLSIEGQEFFGFSDKTDHVPDIDPDYYFDPLTTQTILIGLKYNKRLLIHGLHGTGKSTHIEQVAARLFWPVIRINLDGHLTRSDLVGRDIITLENQQQTIHFQDGLLTHALRRPYILILDEYDAGRPEVMFVIQRLLEEEGRLTLTETNEIIKPHEHFRLCATANTTGTGDETGLYHGTHYINQGQMDRWSLVLQMDYLSPEKEAAIIYAKAPHLQTIDGKEVIKKMVNLANMIRNAFRADNLANILSLRTLIHWAQNISFYHDVILAFKLSYLNKQDEADKVKIAELYQRCFGEELL